jgi:hypothetical protein
MFDKNNASSTAVLPPPITLTAHDITEILLKVVAPELPLKKAL